MSVPFDPFMFQQSVHRRAFLTQSAYGLGGMALASMIQQAPAAEHWSGVIRQPHAPIKARRIIHLCMAGGPSHLETLDWNKKAPGPALPAAVIAGTSEKYREALSRLTGPALPGR